VDRTAAGVTDLVAFIRARLDDDERVALAVPDHRGRRGELRWTQVDPEREPGLIGDELGNVVTYHEGSPSREQAEHIALHDPDRVLREVKAKRLRIEHYLKVRDFADPAKHPDQAYVLAKGALERSLMFDALPYADHPDYDEAWKP
jgi:hypothetical protein